MQFFSDTLVDIGQSLPDDHKRISIPDGYAGTVATIKAMQKVVSFGKRNWKVRSAAADAIRDCPQKDFLCYTTAIFQRVQNFRYVYDNSGAEYLQSPEKTLEIEAGDCDCLVSCLAAMLESIGIPCFFETFKAKKNSNEYTHVALVAVVPGHGKLPLDPTMQYPAGWRAPLESKLWPASLDEAEVHGGGENSSMSGLALPEELTQYGLSACQDDGNYISPEAGSAIDSSIQTMPSDRMRQDVLVTVGTLGNLPIDAGDGEVEDGLAGLDCVECGGTCGQALSGLSGDPQGDATIGSVIDGSAYSELRAAKDESNQNEIAAGQLLASARQIDDPAKRAQAMQMYQQLQSSVTAERQQLQQAINAYSQLANMIQAGSMGLYKPQQLSGLGVAPLVIGGIALAVGVGIYVAAQGFYTAMAAWRGQNDNTKGLIAQLTELMAALGHAPKEAADALSSITKTLLVIAAVGAAGFVGYKLLKRREAV